MSLIKVKEYLKKYNKDKAYIITLNNLLEKMC